MILEARTLSQMVPSNSPSPFHSISTLSVWQRDEENSGKWILTLTSFCLRVWPHSVSPQTWMYQQHGIILLAGLPRNILLFRDKRFILMLMNPLTIQQNILYDTNGSGIQHRRYITLSTFLPFREIQKTQDSQKQHFQVLFSTQKFRKKAQKAESYTLSFLVHYIKCSVKEMDKVCSSVHQVAYIFISLVV